VDGSYTLPYVTRVVRMPGYRLLGRGLRGGHSGGDIHRRRGNAVRILREKVSKFRPRLYALP